MFEHLRILRRRLAEEQQVPAFVVFSDATLKDFARRRPTRRETLLAVHGVGQRKAEQYGESFMSAVSAWCKQNQIETDVMVSNTSDVHIGGPANISASGIKSASSNALRAFPLFDDGISIEEVANRLNLAHSTVISYLIGYIRQRQITDPTRWLDSETAEKIRIAASFRDDQRTKPIFDAFHGRISYDAINIVLACEEQKKDKTEFLHA
ncbi:MAG TPA: HRDC domain-containing protein [Pirellulaceae bacterium]|nr:HRDC domain-containing protein [Pirellulaceae bacterium]HMO92399.1 HRDC domain-containing protein [Pirellulaceae bacterium]HMP69518.1 HRDC domain-containing protein [Pirellulaceae bacterium]